MDKQEFLLLIPAIMYGVAIVDLLKIFNHKKNYIEIVGWGMFVMVGVIFTWIELFNKLEFISSDNMSFFFIIFQAVLFARLAAIITPEEKDIDTKEYFMGIRKKFFWLMTITTLYSILLRYFVYDDSAVSWFRPVIIIIYLTAAYSNKYWLRVSVLALILVLSVLRIFTDALIA
jgi:hypothetical protein